MFKNFIALISFGLALAQPANAFQTFSSHFYSNSYNYGYKDVELKMCNKSTKHSIKYKFNYGKSTKIKPGTCIYYDVEVDSYSDTIDLVYNSSSNPIKGNHVELYLYNDTEVYFYDTLDRFGESVYHDINSY